MDLERAAARTLATPEVAAELGRLGSVDVVVGLTTAGAAPAAADLARSAGAALDNRLSGQSAVFVHADPAPADETVAQMAEALSGRSLLQITGSGLAGARIPGESREADEAVRAVLEVGRQLQAHAVVVLDPSLA